MENLDRLDGLVKVASLHILLEKVRNACIQAALDGFETASADGLCCEGAWEVAVEAMRSVDLSHVVHDIGDHTSSR